MTAYRLHPSNRSGFPSVLRVLLERLGLIPIRQPAYVRRTIALMLLATMTFAVAGCGLPKQWHALANKMPQATPEDPAYQMFCVWEQAEGIGPDKLPTRGFAGKITFFTRRQDTGVRVNGDVRIYVFDDQGPVEERGKPVHQWDFLGDAWSIHLQKSSLGPAYSVFIPYTRKGSHQALCALRVRFTPENGEPIFSDTVAVLLPGTVEPKKDELTLGGSQADERPSLRSITIPLKEKRNSDWADRPLGQTEMHRTIAPVSELHEKHPMPMGKELLTGAEEPPGRSSAVMDSLPSAPSSVLPAAPSPQPPQFAMQQPAAQQPAEPRPLVEDHSARPVSPIPPTHPLLATPANREERHPFE